MFKMESSHLGIMASWRKVDGAVHPSILSSLLYEDRTCQRMQALIECESACAWNLNFSLWSWIFQPSECKSCMSVVCKSTARAID